MAKRPMLGRLLLRPVGLFHKSAAGDPARVLNGLRRRGFRRVSNRLLAPVETGDERRNKRHECEKL